MVDVGWLLRIGALAGIVGLAGAAPAQALAAPVGPGALVCLTTNDGPAVTLHVAEVDGERPARPFWMGRGNADVLVRLDQDQLLLASYGEPYALVVVDLRAGTSRLLADGCPHDFVAVHGDDVLHLGDARERAPILPDNFLYATPWRGAGERRRLADCRAARIAQVAGNLAILIAENEVAVWTVSIVNGTGREVWRPPDGASSLRAALSPGGQRLAIGCVLPGTGKGHLTVVDLGATKVVREWTDLPIQVSPLSSQTPSLEVGWHDDHEVVCSETRSDPRGFAGDFVHVRRRLTDGTIVDESVYASIGLWHAPPPKPNARPATDRALFVTEERGDVVRLLRAGTTTPLAEFQRGANAFRDVRLADDGRSAVDIDGRRQRCTLFTARAPNGRELLAQAGHDVRWLPAVPQAR